MSSEQEKELERSLLVGRDSDARQFDLLAASLRADSTDSHAYLAGLAAKLEGALPPGSVTVERGGGFFSKDKPVRRVVVKLGDDTFSLALESGRMVASRARAVRGVVLKNDIIDFAVWIDDMARSISAEAQRSSAARAALERLLL